MRTFIIRYNQKPNDVNKTKKKAEADKVIEIVPERANVTKNED